jgi:hypothetical protein
MRDKVTTIFDGCLRRIFHPKPELMAYLLKHERKGVCIERVCEQITAAEQRCNIGGALSVERFTVLIETAAKMFANMALEHAKEQALSQAETMRRRHEADRIKRAEELAADLEKEALSTRVTSFNDGKAAR